MIIGIGIDLVEMETFVKLVKKGGERFINHHFTSDEILYCNKKLNRHERYAGKFAAKEAVFKALNLRWENRFNWKEIAVINKYNSAPEIILLGKTKKIADEKKIDKIHISISHTDNYAIAMVIITGGNID